LGKGVKFSYEKAMDLGQSSRWGYSVMALSDGNIDRFDEHDGLVRGVHFHKD